MWNHVVAANHADVATILNANNITSTDAWYIDVVNTTTETVTNNWSYTPKVLESNMLTAIWDSDDIYIAYRSSGCHGLFTNDSASSFTTQSVINLYYYTP